MQGAAGLRSTGRGQGAALWAAFPTWPLGTRPAVSSDFPQGRSSLAGSFASQHRGCGAGTKRPPRPSLVGLQGQPEGAGPGTRAPLRNPFTSGKGWPTGHGWPTGRRGWEHGGALILGGLSHTEPLQARNLGSHHQPGVAERLHSDPMPAPPLLSLTGTASAPVTRAITARAAGPTPTGPGPAPALQGHMHGPGGLPPPWRGFVL